MNNILVVVDESETTTPMLQAAVERAERERAALVVVHVMPQSVYERRQTAIRGSTDLRRDGLTYTITQATETAKGVADGAVEVAIGERAIPYTTVGVVGRPIPAILAVAAEHDCDEIMIAATKQRWFGLFDRFDRTLAKRLGGTVTRVGESRPEPADPVRPVPET